MRLAAPPREAETSEEQVGKYREGAGNDPGAGSAPHVLNVRVYYEDTDFSGVVYHASYLRFLERGRTEFLRSLGIEHQRIFAGGQADGFHFVVRSMALDFLRPALMDDSLCIETRLVSIGGASLEMAQRVLRHQDVLLSATVKIAVVAQGRPRRIPAEVSARLSLFLKRPLEIS